MVRKPFGSGRHNVVVVTDPVASAMLLAIPVFLSASASPNVVTATMATIAMSPMSMAYSTIAAPRSELDTVWSRLTMRLDAVAMTFIVLRIYVRLTISPMGRPNHLTTERGYHRTIRGAIWVERTVKSVGKTL